MIYAVLFTRRAVRELAALPADVRTRLRAALAALASVPRPTGCVKLSEREGWRIREGDYRAIYTIDDSARTVTVIHVAHRRDVYR